MTSTVFQSGQILGTAASHLQLENDLQKSSRPPKHYINFLRVQRRARVANHTLLSIAHHWFTIEVGDDGYWLRLLLQILTIISLYITLIVSSYVVTAHACFWLWELAYGALDPAMGGRPSSKIRGSPWPLAMRCNAPFKLSKKALLDAMVGRKNQKSAGWFILFGIALCMCMYIYTCTYV